MTAAVAISQLVDFLVRCDAEHLVYLPRVGWLTTKRYIAYLGRDRDGKPIPAPGQRHLVDFVRDPALRDELQTGAVSSRKFDDEGARYFDALHPDAQYEPPGTYEAEPAVIHRFEWADALAAEIRSALLAARPWEHPSVGRFEVVERSGRPGVDPDTGAAIVIPARPVVRFAESAAMKARLVGKW